jgi:hypothetical protein
MPNQRRAAFVPQLGRDVLTDSGQLAAIGIDA